MTAILGGKVALVTGGAAGIGEGAVRVLAAQGASVAICDRDTERGQALAAELNAKGQPAAFFQADYLDASTGTAAVKAVVAHFGALDIVVNNVGGVSPRMLVDQNTGNWERVLNLNLMSMIATTQEAARHLRDGGAIVNVASTEALRAAPGFSIYSAAKAAMTQFTKTMALELSGRAIRVNCIAPDHVATPGLGGLMSAPPEERDRHVPLARMASIEEVGQVIAFLAGPTSSWITGTTIPVDGGITAAAGWRRDAAGVWGL